MLFTNLILIPLHGSICDLDHCEADDLVTHRKAGLEDLRNDVFRHCLVLDVHDGVVPRGVKRLSGSAERLDAQRIEDLDQLVHGHLNALFVRLIRRLVLQRAFKIVIDRKELLGGIRLCLLIDAVLLALCTLAEIIVFRRQTQVLVMLFFLRCLGKLQLRRLRGLLDRFGGLLGFRLRLLLGHGGFLFFLCQR